MQSAAGDRLALGRTPSDGVVEGIDSDLRLHPVTDRIPDDPVRPDVLDRAQVELPFDDGWPRESSLFKRAPRYWRSASNGLILDICAASNPAVQVVGAVA
jgi:hypothetical protein